MMQLTSADSQRLAARIAGYTLLLLIVSGLLGNFVFQAHITVAGDASATARNILAHERFFRAGLACQIVMFNCDVVLAVALYALLKPVNGPLALLGTFWRVANAIVGGTGIVAALVALDILNGTLNLSSLTAAQAQALASLFFDIGHAGTVVCLIFFGLGAATHSYLLLKSRYIPKILSALYLFVSLQIFLCWMALVIFPHMSSTVSIVVLAQDLPIELAVAVWLAFKGASIP